MSPILTSRFHALVLAVVLALFAVLPAPTARADSEPPFEVRFPQEVDKTSFVNSWGARRSGGRRHKGTDLMSEKMTQVYALADGVVTTISTSRLAGRYIVIEHGDGWESYYIHLNNDTPGTDNGDAPWYLTVAPGLEEGSRVVAGELVGWVGDSGNAEGSQPHTHFELLHNGVNLNAYHVLSAAYEADQLELEQRSLLLGYRVSGKLSIF